MWGVDTSKDKHDKKKHNRLITSETIDGRFNKFNDTQLKNYMVDYQNLGPAKNRVHKVQMWLDNNLPFEFLVDKELLLLEDIDMISVSEDLAIEIKEYIIYKQDPSSYKGRRVINVLVNNLDEFEEFKTNLSEKEVVFKPIIDVDDLAKVLEEGDTAYNCITFLILNDINKELADEMKTVHDVMFNLNEEFIILDLGQTVDVKGNVIRIYVYNDRISKMLKSENMSLLKTMDYHFDTDKHNVVDVENTEIIVNTVDTDNNEDNEDDEIIVDNSDDVINDISDEKIDIENENVDLDLDVKSEKTVDELLAEQAKLNEESEENVYVKKVAEKARKEEAEKYTKLVSELKEEIELHKSNIQTLEDRVRIASDTNKEISDENKSLRSTNIELADELNTVREELSMIKEVNLKQEGMLENYFDLKNFKDTYEEVLDRLNKEHLNKVANLKSNLDGCKKANEELKIKYEQLYDLAEDSSPDKIVNYMSKVNCKVIYFNILDDLIYFNTIISALIDELSKRGKVLVVAVKNIRTIDSALWNSWGDINSESDKILIEKFTIKIGKKLEEISKDFDYIIALDYACEKIKFVQSINTNLYDVVKNKSKQKLLGYNNLLISKDKDSFININYDPKMESLASKKARDIYVKRNKGIDNIISKIDKIEEIIDKIEEIIDVQVENIKEVEGQ